MEENAYSVTPNELQSVKLLITRSNPVEGSAITCQQVNEALFSKRVQLAWGQGSRTSFSVTFTTLIEAATAGDFSEAVQKVVSSSDLEIVQSLILSNGKFVSKQRALTKAAQLSQVEIEKTVMFTVSGQRIHISAPKVPSLAKSGSNCKRDPVAKPAPLLAAELFNSTTDNTALEETPQVSLKKPFCEELKLDLSAACVPLLAEKSNATALYDHVHLVEGSNHQESKESPLEHIPNSATESNLPISTGAMLGTVPQNLSVGENLSLSVGREQQSFCLEAATVPLLPSEKSLPDASTGVARNNVSLGNAPQKVSFNVEATPPIKHESLSVRKRRRNLINRLTATASAGPKVNIKIPDASIPPPTSPLEATLTNHIKPALIGEVAKPSSILPQDSAISLAEERVNKKAAATKPEFNSKIKTQWVKIEIPVRFFVTHVPRLAAQNNITPHWKK
ncbi:hypothetical protein BDR26DRAFT_854711 [Obelidium mucronatum]|nr:hypothetical protein BDR26DRAFT_854711 [Obelidium mucronatum]